MLYLGIDQYIKQIPNSLREENGDVKRLICARRLARSPLFSTCVKHHFDVAFPCQLFRH